MAIPNPQHALETEIRHRQSWKRRAWFFVAPVLACLTLAVLGAAAGVRTEAIDTAIILTLSARSLADTD